MIEAREF